VKNAAQYLKGNTKHYMFISTTSVYADQSEIGINENSPTVPMPAGLDPYQPDQRNTAQLAASSNPGNYGAFKARAEVEVQNQYPGINTIIRPCLIVGPLDRTDRFTYWPARIDQGGEVLAPDKPDDPCQFIDSRDLAEFMIRMAEMREFGTYNAIGPEKPMTIAEMLYGVKAVTTAGATQRGRGWRLGTGPARTRLDQLIGPRRRGPLTRPCDISAPGETASHDNGHPRLFRAGCCARRRQRRSRPGTGGHRRSCWRKGG